MIHRPVEDQRLFRPDKLYSEIAWNDFRTVVSEFKGRIEAWYLEPARALTSNGDFAFAVMSINCLLIDALSQYRYGEQQSPTEKLKNCTSKILESSHFKFEDFLTERLPSLATSLPTPIRTGRTKKNGDPEELFTIAEVLYSGFRCGILHEAHIPLYGAISGQSTVVSWHPSGLTRYDDNGGFSDCPTVVIYPQQLLGMLDVVFVSYIEELLNPDRCFNELRLRYKEKFEDSFGVTIDIRL